MSENPSSLQTLSLGSQAEGVKAALDRLSAEQFFKRLWEKDASLWSSDAAVAASIRNRLGWLTIAGVMAQKVEVLQRFRQEIYEASCAHLLLLGMGGSGLFSEVCRNTFGLSEAGPDLTVLDTTDPTAIRIQTRRCPIERLFVIVSSKSGSTSEIEALSKYFYDAFKRKSGSPGDQCIAITDAGTSLEAQAGEWRFRRVFAHGAGEGLEVGGRFSALTYFGLVPAALIGVDVEKLLRRAEAMFKRCREEAAPHENPAAQLGAIMGVLSRAGRDKLTLLCAPALSSFGTWVEQLIAESLGKQGRGIAPIHGEPLRQPSAYGSDRFFVELQLSEALDETLDQRVRALIEAGEPVIRIHWRDRYDLGGEVAKWFLATAVAGHLMELNPFDEPNVKESKDRTKALLERYTREGGWPKEEEPLYADSAIAVYGKDLSAADSLQECLSAFFARLRGNDYISLLSFLPRSTFLDRALHTLRRQLDERLKRSTMLGFGPRYLHSTGQLFKGGPDAALFLLFTAEEAEDLPIPGEPFTFGVLKQAQAMGDFEAMQQRRRRILRLHLRGDLEEAIQKLMGTIDQATADLSRR